MLRYLLALTTLSVLPLSIGCQKAEFKEFCPAGGGFKIAMPGTPRDQAPKDVSVKIYMVATKDGNYFVGYSDSQLPPDASEKQVQHRFDLAREGQLTSSGGTLVSESSIQLEGKYPGREIFEDIPAKKAFARSRIYFVNGKLFQVFVVGKESWVKSPDADRFFDSFALTK